MSHVQTKLNQNRVQEAHRLVMTGNYLHPAQMVLAEEGGSLVEENFVQGTIVAIKRQTKVDPKKLGNIPKYSRLVLLKELREGESFYVVYRDDKEAVNGLKMIGGSFLGAFVMLYEPELIGNCHGVPLLTCEKSFIPITPALEKVKTVTPKELSLMEGGEFDGSVSVATVCLEVDTPVFAKPKLVAMCGSQGCDGGHRGLQLCPSTTRTNHSGYGLSARLGLPSLAKSCEFVSRRVSELFLSEAVMTNSTEDVVDLRDSARATVGKFKTHNTKWILFGWLKKGSSEDGTLKAEANLHITALFPRSVPADLVKFTGGAATVAAPSTPVQAVPSTSGYLSPDVANP